MSFLERGRAAAAIALLCGAPWPVSAQSVRPDRPFLGLFGAAGAPERGQSLALDWGLLGGYDDNPAASGGGNDPRAAVNGEYGSATGALTYGIRSEHRSFGATGTTSGRYYPDASALSAVDGGGGLTFISDLGRRTKLDVAQSFAYQPYYGINFLGAVVPSEAAIVEVGGGATNQAALSSRSSYSLDGRAGLARSLGPRSTVRADYSYRSMQFSGGDESFNWRLVSATFLRNLTRNAVLRVGYGYGVGKDTVASATPSIVNHNLDLGIDYNRQLSFSRRTRINFSSGSTGVVDDNKTTYRLIGSAGLTQEIGRTWRATAAYNRGVQYLPGFGQSFFADTAQVRLAGLIGRRVEASASGGHSAGQLGLEARGSSYSSSTAGADLRVAMSRRLSFFAQYAYYRYGFDTGVQVPFGLPPQLDRQSIRFGISGWLPLVR